MAKPCKNLPVAFLRANLRRVGRDTAHRRPGRTAARSITFHSHAQHADSLSRLSSNVDTASDVYRQNVRDMDEVMSLFRRRHEKIQKGGTAKAREKHVARGKMLPREYGTYKQPTECLILTASQGGLQLCWTQDVYSSNCRL